MRPMLLLAGVALACAACGDATAPTAGADGPAAPEASLALAKLAPGPRDQAVFDLGKLGTIRVELFPELAPRTVARFSELAESGFYDGTYFHRVIPGFMIQGGDPNTKNLDPRDDGRGSAGERIADEFTDYPHQRGTLSMANTGYAGSSSSQFFIVHQDSPNLDGRFTAFGRVVEGIEAVDAVTELEIDRFGRYGPTNRPYPVDAVVHSIRIEHGVAPVDLAGASGGEAAPAAPTRTAAVTTTAGTEIPVAVREHIGGGEVVESGETGETASPAQAH